MAPNGWGVVFSLAVLFWLRCRKVDELDLPRTDQLLACFEVKWISKKPGRYYFCARKGAWGILKGLSSIKKWVGKWFYASDAWLAKDEFDQIFHSMPCRFGNLGKKSSQCLFFIIPLRTLTLLSFCLR